MQMDLLTHFYCIKRKENEIKPLMPEDHMKRCSVGFYVNIMHLLELEFIDLLSPSPIRV